MLFSHRKGYKPVSKIIQKVGMNANLRNSIWNVFDIFVWKKGRFMEDSSFVRDDKDHMESYSQILWFSYFKQPIDSRPPGYWNILGRIREYFFSCQWYEVYDFVQFTLNYFHDEELNRMINAILDRELSGYRFVNGVITDITGPQEIEMLESAFADNDFPTVNAHLQRALELLSNRDRPDYRNSIKESISAVEALARVVSGNEKATLADALKIIKQQGKLHPALKDAFSKLYGYTSDKDGIRHAMLEEPNLSPADAKFFLLSCTSFINYLKSKI